MNTFLLKCDTIDEEVLLEKVEFNFLYATLFKLDCKFELGIFDQDNVKIHGDALEYLHGQIKIELNDLLNSFYSEPDPKKRSKYPSRYENIFVGEKKYTVDYTLSRLGRLMFTLYLRLNFLKKVMDLNETIVVRSVG